MSCRCSIAVAMLGLATVSGAEPPKFEVGQHFPDVVLPSAADGTPMSLAPGRKTILHVFASW